ncbi:hypothetical protein [Roseateles amylovorans]|uniref:Uncharacterized protein n=1 Tax=Roseateles amylovorans TaxID=2978473 RepID=A0ABY6B657_9BURK|nr:hypothetical protein [Roseateles amylovorans]UXH79808.1 hypothetical protein N4261_07945 [Roseateles amylovorans]
MYLSPGSSPSAADLYTTSPVENDLTQNAQGCASDTHDDPNGRAPSDDLAAKAPPSPVVPGVSGRPSVPRPTPTARAAPGGAAPTDAGPWGCHKNWRSAVASVPKAKGEIARTYARRLLATFPQLHSYQLVEATKISGLVAEHIVRTSKSLPAEYAHIQAQCSRGPHEPNIHYARRLQETFPELTDDIVCLISGADIGRVKDDQRTAVPLGPHLLAIAQEMPRLEFEVARQYAKRLWTRHANLTSMDIRLLTGLGYRASRSQLLGLRPGPGRLTPPEPRIAGAELVSTGTVRALRSTEGGVNVPTARPAYGTPLESSAAGNVGTADRSRGTSSAFVQGAGAARRISRAAAAPYTAPQALDLSLAGRLRAGHPWRDLEARYCMALLCDLLPPRSLPAIAFGADALQDIQQMHPPPSVVIQGTIGGEPVLHFKEGPGTPLEGSAAGWANALQQAMPERDWHLMLERLQTWAPQLSARDTEPGELLGEGLANWMNYQRRFDSRTAGQTRSAGAQNKTAAASIEAAAVEPSAGGAGGRTPTGAKTQKPSEASRSSTSD